MFDMNQCKAGDKLVCRDGDIAIYVYKQNHEIYPHVVRIEDPEGEWPMSTTDLGNRYGEHKSSYDIIGFYKEEVVMKEPEMIERDKEYDLKVTGEQLAYIFAVTGKTASGYCASSDLYDKIKDMSPKQFKSCMSAGTAYMNLHESETYHNYLVEVFTKPETEEERKKRELLEQYDATKKQLEELGKQLGIE